MKRPLPVIIIILLGSCKLFNNVDSVPYFVSGTPVEEVTNTNIGNTHTVKGNAEDPDGDQLNYNVINTSDGESNDNGTISITINNTPDNPLSNIVSYEWKALNNEENLNLNNADQAQTTLTANTRGNYQLELTTDDNARYIFDYSQDNSRFSPDYIQKDGVWYIDDATIFISNSKPESMFESLKGSIKHELFCHGLGWPTHSEDPQDLSSVPVFDSKTTQNEINAKQLELKLDGGTELKNYEIE